MATAETFNLIPEKQKQFTDALASANVFVFPSNRLRKIYLPAQARITRKQIMTHLPVVDSIDSDILTGSNCEEPAEYQRHVMCFAFGDIILTLRGGACMESKIMQEVVIRLMDDMFRKRNGAGVYTGD